MVKLQILFSGHLYISLEQKKSSTRMHSSRMRTGRSLTVCRRGSPCQGGSPCPGGVSLPGGLLARGVLPARGVLLPRGSPWGGLLARGVSLPGGGPPCWGGLLARGSPCQGGLPAGGGLPARGVSLPETPPVDRITDTSKNITLATTSLRPVMMTLQIATGAKRKG